MNLGGLLAFLKLAQDAGVTKPVRKELYTKETALERAKEGGLGL